MKKRGKGKRVKDEAVLHYWSGQRVVHRKVDGKWTYVLISGELPPGVLFPTEVTRRRDAGDSGLQRNTVRRNSAVPATTSHGTASATGNECPGNEYGDQAQGGRINANDRNSVEESSVTCDGQQMVIAEKPLAVETCVSSSDSSRSPIHEQSLAEVRQHPMSGAHGLEASTELINSDAVINHITDDT